MDVIEFCRTLTRRAPTIEGRRALFRKELRRPGYSGRWHVGLVVAITVSTAAMAFGLVESWGLAELLAIAGAMLVSMTAIYFGHRYPMHRPVRGMSVLYALHTRAHHMMFNDEHAEIRTLDDVDMVMLPPRWALGLCVVVMPLIASPLLLVSLDTALAFVATASLYYLAYELVHLAAHAPDGHRIHRTPLIGWLTRHHRIHHDWRRMHDANFGVVVPLWDLLLGTRDCEQRSPLE